jgi:hypothetical protein
MNEQLGIIFLHHHIDRVVSNNLRSVQLQNPDATIATISADKPLPGGYTLNATPELKRLHSSLLKRSGDRLLCSWFIQRKEKCDKWWIIEWDTFCATSVRNYYLPVWDFPYVASGVRLPYREPEWQWFKKFKKKHWFRRVQKWPEDYQPFAMGAVPFLYLLSEAALKATCTMLLENPLMVGNSELRFATAANRCGYAPCGFSPPNDQIGWMPLKIVAKQPKIFHPVKHFVEF